jgi:hypothetical protein
MTIRLLIVGIVFSIGLRMPRNSIARTAHSGFVGFDRNDYPGDSNLKSLRRTFSYSGYWLNIPPRGENKFLDWKTKGLAVGRLRLSGSVQRTHLRGDQNCRRCREIGVFRCRCGSAGRAHGRLPFAHHRLPRSGARWTPASRTAGLSSCLDRWREFRAFSGGRVLFRHCCQRSLGRLHRNRARHPRNCRRKENHLLGSKRHLSALARLRCSAKKSVSRIERRFIC